MQVASSAPKVGGGWQAMVHLLWEIAACGLPLVWSWVRRASCGSPPLHWVRKLGQQSKHLVNSVLWGGYHWWEKDGLAKLTSQEQADPAL